MPAGAEAAAGGHHRREEGRSQVQWLGHLAIQVQPQLLASIVSASPIYQREEEGRSSARDGRGALVVRRSRRPDEWTIPALRTTGVEAGAC